MAAASRLMLRPAGGRWLVPTDLRPLVRELAAMWADELLLVADQNCAKHGCLRSSAGGTSTFVDPSAQRAGGLVLSSGESFHLLLHLLDIAVSSGELCCSVALASISDAAAILAKAGEWLGEQSSLWMALITFGGALTFRSLLSADEVSHAMRLASIAVFAMHFLSPEPQAAVLAFIYTLRMEHDCNVDKLIVGLVDACVASVQRALKEETGRLIHALYGPERLLPICLTDQVYALQGDCNDGVRAIWSQLACCVNVAALRPERHAFAALKCSLRFDVCRDVIGASVRNKALAFTATDAMLVVKAICDSVNDRESVVADVGLSSSALDVILAVSGALGRQCSGSVSIFDMVCWAVMAAANKVRALATLECQAVAAHLVGVVKTCMASHEPQGDQLQLQASTTADVDKSTKTTDCLYWVLEFLFHLGWPENPATAKMLNSLDTQLLLLNAAVASSNITFSLLSCQTALRNSLGSSSNSSVDGVMQRLLLAAPWSELSQMLENEAGDSVEALLRLRANEVSDIRDVLSGLSLHDINAVASDAALATFDESVTGASNQSVQTACSPALPPEVANACRMAECRATVAYAESRVNALAMADRLLNRSVCRSLCLMPPSSVARLSFGGVAMHRHNTALSLVELLPETADFTAVSSIAFYQHAAALLAAEHERTDLKHLPPLWEHYLDLRIASMYMLSGLSSADSSLLVTPLFASRVVAEVPANDRLDICFAQKLPEAGSSIAHMHSSILPFISDMALNSALSSIDAMVARGVNPAKAREAMLYFTPYNGPSCNATDTLYTYLLSETSGRIRFTASGTFDPAARLVLHMSSNPLSVPTLKTDMLSKNAVRQLAAYIPQLLAMLCYSKRSGGGGGGSLLRATASDSAYAILELLATSAPELVVFHVVVASRSLPELSSGGRLAARLLRLFDEKQVADICAFLTYACSIATLPQEQMRRLCIKANSAHNKVVAAFQQGKFGRAVQKAAVAFSEPLVAAAQMLEEYTNGRVTQSLAESDFVATIPRLSLLLEQLRYSAEFSADSSNLKRDLEQVWAEIFKTLRTPKVMPVSYISPKLSEFTAAIPIPVLTDPTEPLYFTQVHNTVSIIGSKTRPKLLSLYLASRDGKVASKKYIIKGSEDLRIDECVIQTFVRLNRVVASKYSAGPCDSGLGSTDGASTCATAQLTVYNVVPIDVHGGLIEVVENAPSLVQMYSQHAARADALTDHANSASAHGGSPTGATSMDSRPQRQPASDIQQTYMSHAQRVLKAANLPTNTPFAKWPARVTTDTYESLLRLTPVDLLHRQLQREAQSSAHLYLATKNMVKSIGINSVAGYMLGLGDRHLDNLLVNVRSGKLVQIDFNVCFDFGGVSQFPELVPFRMTPILEYLCGSPAQVAVSSPNSAVSVVQRPYALTRVFALSAEAALQFARMDRHTLVGGIARRAQFRPFMEWAWMEESWLRDKEEGKERRVSSMDLAMPRQMPAAAATLWSQSRAVPVDSFIRGTGLCPRDAFWPRALLDDQPAITEVPFGWRIAREAVGRIDARLDYQGVASIGPGGNSLRSQDELVKEQLMTVWGAATDRERLSKMYMGWASWI